MSCRRPSAILRRPARAALILCLALPTIPTIRHAFGRETNEREPFIRGDPQPSCVWKFATTFPIPLWTKKLLHSGITSIRSEVLVKAKVFLMPISLTGQRFDLHHLLGERVGCAPRYAREARAWQRRGFEWKFLCHRWIQL